MAIAPADDLVSLLTQDHAAICQRLSEFDSVGASSRAELFWKLTDQLVRHEVGEAVVVYPTVKDLPGGAEVSEARTAEEAEAERLLATMEDLDPTSTEFVRTLGELRGSSLRARPKRGVRSLSPPSGARDGVPNVVEVRRWSPA